MFDDMTVTTVPTYDPLTNETIEFVALHTILEQVPTNHTFVIGRPKK